jgi:Tfp pilus assembly protein PilF
MPISAKAREESEVHNDLGVQAFQNRRFQEAMKEWQTSLEFNPEFALPHGGLGIIYMYYWTGPKLAEAKKEFLKAVALDPHYAEAWNNLGTLYADEGDLPKAQDAFEHALGEPFYKTPWIAQANLGWVIHLQGHTEQGKLLIRQAIVTNGTYCMAHRLLARILGNEGKAEDADVEWEAFARQCPTEPEAALHAGSIMLKRGRPSQALTWFKACAEAVPVSAYTADCRRELAALPAGTVAPKEKSLLPQPMNLEPAPNAELMPGSRNLEETPK